MDGLQLGCGVALAVVVLRFAAATERTWPTKVAESVEGGPMTRAMRLWRIVAGGFVGVIVGAPAAWAQEAAAPEGPRLVSGLVSLFLTWLPIVIIIGMWVWFMRRSGAREMPARMERSMAHMDRVEQQNEQILASLQRIEQVLAERRGPV